MLNKDDEIILELRHPLELSMMVASLSLRGSTLPILCLQRHSRLAPSPVSFAGGLPRSNRGQSSRLALPKNVRSRRSWEFDAKQARCTVPNLLD